MSQSAAPATQNNITTCLETFEKERFCSFPHRHGEATGKPETIFILCSFKIDVFLRVFLGTTSKFATSKSMFRAKLPSIFITSHKMPHLPRNLHLVATWRSPTNAICKNTQHDMLRLPRKMTMDTSKVLRLPRKLQRIFWKSRKSIAPATQNDFRHVTKHVWMSQSAMPATRNEATRRLKPPKMTPFAELTIGTAIRPSRERLRTVADGCRRLRTVRQPLANTPSTPRPPEWNGNPCYAFGKKGTSSSRLCEISLSSFVSVYASLGRSFEYESKIKATCINL